VRRIASFAARNRIPFRKSRLHRMKASHEVIAMAAHCSLDRARPAVVFGKDQIIDPPTPRGFFITGVKEDGGSACATSCPGIFAVGDVRARSVKRVASAVGEGSAMMSAVWTHVNG
jgi:thioredoxin reductase